jgi:hypothetical protein
MRCNNLLTGADRSEGGNPLGNYLSQTGAKRRQREAEESDGPHDQRIVVLIMYCEFKVKVNKPQAQKLLFFLRRERVKVLTSVSCMHTGRMSSINYFELYPLSKIDYLDILRSLDVRSP